MHRAVVMMLVMTVMVIMVMVMVMFMRMSMLMVVNVVGIVGFKHLGKGGAQRAFHYRGRTHVGLLWHI